MGKKKNKMELTDEMLDAMADGADAPGLDAISAWTAQFGVNNCLRCAGPCIYDHGPADVYLMGLDASAACPGLRTEDSP